MRERRRRLRPRRRGRWLRFDRYVVNAAYATGVGSGPSEPYNAPPSSTSPPPVPKPARPNKAPPKPTTRNYDNYTSAAELGIIDPDVQRRMEEAERRREEAFVGEWTVVESAPSRGISAAPREEGEDTMKVEDGDVKLEDGVEIGQKRPFPATADDDEDAGHRWKLRKKTAAVGLGELYDPGVMKLKPRVKPQPVDAELPNTIGSDAAGWTGAGGENRLKATEAPKWTSVKWRKPGEAPEASMSSQI
ncbi:hypothetical protein PENSPDRAFT_725165, partial [Peniophora sp. CONT]